LFVGMLFYGPLSDKYGRRRLLLGGIILYLIATIGCMLASALHDGTALPMALIIGLTGCGSLAALALTRRPAT